MTRGRGDAEGPQRSRSRSVWETDLDGSRPDRQAEPWDRLAPSYDARFTGPVAQAEDVIVADWLRLLLRRQPPDALVVDLGCGTGHLLDLLPEIPRDRYLGLDVSAQMLALASCRHPGYSFRVHDFRAAHALWRPALIVCLYGTPSYVSDPIRTFKTWARVAQPGDELFWMFSGPNYLRRKGHVVGESQLVPLGLGEIALELAVIQDSLVDAGVFGFSPPLPLPPLPRFLHGTRLARLLVRLLIPWLASLTAHAPTWSGHTYWCVAARRLVRADGR